MRKPKILVTAAAGKTGSATALQLLAKGYPVRALTRQDDHRSGILKRAGAEIMIGSLEDPVDLRISLKGVQRAYFCPPLESGALRKAMLFATAAHSAKLEALVVLSQWLVDSTHPSIHAREKWITEQILSWIPDVAVVTINPGWFADNYMVALESIAQFGLMAMPLGDGLNAPPSNEDIARVIVGALTNPASHAGKSYRPTGPRLLAPQEIAATFGKVLGRRVRYQDLPMWLFLKVAKSLGVTDYVIAQLQSFLDDYRRNAFGIGAPTDAVLNVGGTEPEAFEQVARRYVALSSVAKQTVGAKLHATWNLLRGLLTRTPDLDAIARRIELPVIASAKLAADSAAWRASHDPGLKESS